MEEQQFCLYAAVIRVEKAAEDPALEIKGPFRSTREETVLDLHMMSRVARAFGHTAGKTVRAYKMMVRPL
jgi:hypothetical protein